LVVQGRTPGQERKPYVITVNRRGASTPIGTLSKLLIHLTLEGSHFGAYSHTASPTITKDLFAQASGPIVIGHHCELTGVFTSWGLWHDKAAKAAVDIVNKGGGIAGRKVELVTEDTESDPATGARKLRNLIQRNTWRSRV
jgi:ABC-type branched-subunit amino acid transport system substrate-binding protein